MRAVGWVGTWQAARQQELLLHMAGLAWTSRGSPLRVMPNSAALTLLQQLCSKLAGGLLRVSCLAPHCRTLACYAPSTYAAPLQPTVHEAVPR